MSKLIRDAATGLAAALLYLSSAAAQAAATADMSYGDGDPTPGAGAMVADFAVVRPLSLAATVLGIGAFVVSLPFSAASGDVSGPARRLVVEPAEYTFTRPLGDLE